MGSPQSWTHNKPDVQTWARSPGRQREGVIPSPNAEYFFCLSYRGDPQSDQTVYTLQVFDTERTRVALRRTKQGGAVHGVLAEVSFRSAEQGEPGILDPRWEPDGRGVLFRAIADRGHYEAHRLDVLTGIVEQLTDTPQQTAGAARGVEWFDYRAGRQIYRVENFVELPITARYPMEAVLRVGRVITSRLDASRFDSAYYTSRGARGRPQTIEPFSTAAISPNGRWAITYTGYPARFALLKFDDAQDPQKLMTVAAGPGPAPDGRVFWTADSSQAVLVGIQPEGDSGADASVAALASVAAYDTGSGTWRRLEQLPSDSPVDSVDWSEARGQLTLSWGASKGKPESAEFQFKDNQWSRRASQAASAKPSPFGPLTVEIRQNENEPPRLVASEGKRELLLVASDPALQGVRLTRVQRFTWRDPDGAAREGGLLLPMGYRSGHPVPVVIQPYYYLPDLFLPDGQSKTGDAAQALAARGIAVLVIESIDLMPKSGMEVIPSPSTEGPQVVRRIDAIVDALVGAGITRPTQIAMLGFSRGGYQTFYTLTHPRRTCLAAVGIMDAFTASFPEYLDSMALGIAPSTFSAAGRSYWEEPAYWLEHDVFFNLDRAPAPALFSQTSMDIHLDNSKLSLQTMGALMMNDKPFEYLYLNRAAHLLRLPLQRSVLMSSVVDWMAFWLLGEEDPDPSKAAQNQRWRGLRESWMATRAKDPSRGESGFITTRSGLMYAIRTRTEGRVPVSGDVLTFNYVGTRADGTQFANTYQRGTPRTLRVGKPDLSEGPSGKAADTEQAAGRVGRGWEEGLTLMRVGEKATFVMPSELASAAGWGESVPAGESVRYEVELAGVERE